MKFLNKLLLVFFAIMAINLAHAETAALIDANVEKAMTAFRASVKDADEFLAAGKGALVIPQVKKAGLIVGAQWGEGALQINGKPAAYYKMKAGSVGFQAGYQEAHYLFIFLTQESLDKFRRSKGWDAGVEGGVTLMSDSIGFSADTLKGKAAVIAFIYGKEGLMAGGSLKGQKLTKFTPGTK